MRGKGRRHGRLPPPHEVGEAMAATCPVAGLFPRLVSDFEATGQLELTGRRRYEVSAGSNGSASSKVQPTAWFAAAIVP